MSLSRLLCLSAAAVAGVVALAIELPTSRGGGLSLVSRAEAVIGRPLTPMSYAGVARRTTRRAYVAGAATATTVVVAPRPGCYQAVDAYGRVFWRCP